ncbi:MAG: MGMT family protein [Caldilineaceae bacterium]|nr:MGMT family protein [Caldilineaceae bacterium]
MRGAEEMGGERVNIYERMLLVVREIPFGRVATYGQIAWIAGAASPRMAGNALGGLAADTDVPWQRVVNAKGGVSPRGDPLATDRQRKLLMEEGVRFETDGRIDLDRFGWDGPDPEWLEANDFTLLPWRARG